MLSHLSRLFRVQNMLEARTNGFDEAAQNELAVGIAQVSTQSDAKRKVSLSSMVPGTLSPARKHPLDPLDMGKDIIFMV